MQSTELVNRYVNAVGENLPKKSRGDIQAELRSLLIEMLDARSEAEGRPVDEAMTVAVLREFGDPAQVAQRYAPSRPLIGPAYLPIFITVVKIVAIVMLVVWAVGLGIGIVNSGGTTQPILPILWSSVVSLIGQMLANFGLIVIIFVVMEHFFAKPPVSGAEPWDPVKLPAIENPNRVDRTDAIFTIIGNIVVLAILNFLPNLGGVIFYQAGSWQSVPLFGPGFDQYLPWIYLSCGIEIVLYAYILLRGTWSRVTRVIEIGSGLFAVAIIGVMLSSTEPLAASPALEPLVKLGLVAILVILLIDVVLNLYRLVTKRWNAQAPADMELVSNGQHS